MTLTACNSQRTLAQRVMDALGQAPSSPLSKEQAKERCLLLDTSGSMSEDVEPGQSKIDALRSLALQFPHERKFAFASGCTEVSQIPQPGGTTDMAAAFAHIKKEAGIRHAVLITDGLPDSEGAALREARGLRLDILYVGPPPRPAFLERLAQATGGSFHATTLRRQDAPVLVTHIRRALPAPSHQK